MKDDMKKMAMKKSLMQLIDMMDELESEDYGDKLGSMKKVTVAAPDEKSLMKGLSKAEQLLKMREGMDSEGEEEEEEFEEESEESEESEGECEECEGCPKCKGKMLMPMMMKKRKMME